MEKLRGLKCRECGRSYPSAPTHICEFCFGPLEVDYDYEALRGLVTRASIAAGPPSIWRYKDLLPIEGESVANTNGVWRGRGGLARPRPRRRPSGGAWLT